MNDKYDDLSGNYLCLCSKITMKRIMIGDLALILGEGPTEFFYFKSLSGCSIV